jgi:HK97 family phage portal protein
MNFIESVKRFFNPSFNTMYYVGYSQMSNGPKNIFPTTCIYNTAIEICSTIIANTVASIPIGLYVDENGFDKVVKDDPRYHMLHHNPNGYTNRYIFWHTMEKVKQKEGESFAIIHKFPKTNMVELEFVPTPLIVGLPFFEGGFLKYRFATNNGQSIFDASEVIHLKRDTFNGISAVKPYEVLQEEIKRIYLANKTITNYYENDGKSTKLLKTTVTSGELAKLEKAANKFREETGGTYINDKGEIAKGSFDKIVAFPRLPGNSEIQELSNDQNDALYLATIEKAVLAIAAYYQIPPHYLNIMAAQKNNNVQTLQLDFKSSTIAHTLNSNRQELEMKLLKTYEIDKGMSIKYNTDAILELSTEERMRRYEALQKVAFMTPNEVRQVEGMPSIDGGNEHYLFDQFTTLNQMNKEFNTKDTSTN